MRLAFHGYIWACGMKCSAVAAWTRSAAPRSPSAPPTSGASTADRSHPDEPQHREQNVRRSRSLVHLQRGRGWYSAAVIVRLWPWKKPLLSYVSPHVAVLTSSFQSCSTQNPLINSFFFFFFPAAHVEAPAELLGYFGHLYHFQPCVQNWEPGSHKELWFDWNNQKEESVLQEKKI